MAAQHDDNAPPTAEELAQLERDLAWVKAGSAGWGQAEAHAMKLLPRLFRAYKAVLADADTYVHHEGKAAGRKEAIADIVAMLKKEHAAGSIGSADFWARVITENVK